MKSELDSPHHKAKTTSSNVNQLTREDQMPKEEINNFDETAIINRYHYLQHSQYKQLAQTNLSNTLKQKLFGFSTDSLFCNRFNPEDLLIESHPNKGKIVMSKNKYENRQKQQLRQRTIKANHQLHIEEIQNSEERMKDISTLKSADKHLELEDKHHEPEDKQKMPHSQIRLVEHSQI